MLIFQSLGLNPYSYGSIILIAIEIPFNFKFTVLILILMEVSF